MGILNIIKYVILGIVQGITEPLPISSSGHLVILGNLFNTEFNDLNFEIMINFGSMIAIIYFFRNELLKTVYGGIKYITTGEKTYKSYFNYIMLLIVGTIPAGIAGLLLKDKIEQQFVLNTKLIGFCLLITALFLYLIRNFKGIKNDNKITFKDALTVGIFQAIAIIPGISRSGTTLVGGMLSDFKRETALKFSFFLYIPVSLGSFILGLSDIINTNQLNTVWLPYTLGTIASAIMTYYATKFFVDITLKGKLIYFVYYCLIAGTLTILFL